MCINGERRRLVRFNIPDAKIVYEQEAGFQSAKDLVGTGKLVDLSLKSAKFESKHQLTPGAKLQIWLLLQDGPIIPLVGIVPRLSEEVIDNSVHSIIEFNSFSDDGTFNSIASKFALESLNEQFA